MVLQRKAGCYRQVNLAAADQRALAGHNKTAGLPTQIQSGKRRMGLPVEVAKVGRVTASADAVGLRRRKGRGRLGQTIPDDAAATAK